MTKKILLIIGILIVLGVALFLIFGEGPTGTGESRVGFSFTDYFPFGKDNTANDNATTTLGTKDDENTSDTTTGQAQPIPKLRKISNEPVAGAVAFNIGTTTFVRFVEKGTGNVYEVREDSLKIDRLTNTTIPKIIRAFWLPNGSGFLAQTLVPESETIETSFVLLSKPTSTGGTENLTPFVTRISKLPTGIEDLSVSPDSKRILYYTVVDSGASFYTANPDGTGQTLVAAGPLTEWLVRYWSSNTSVVIQTKESASVPPRFYLLDTAKKVMTKITSPMVGINKSVTAWADKCALPIDKDLFVYCAVSDQPTGPGYLDSWYKGEISLTDSINKIDTKNNVYYNTANLVAISDEKIDVVDMSSSSDKTHLIFRNKTDGYLWMLRVEE